MPEDKLAGLALLDYLDVYFAEHVDRLTFAETGWILFVFAKCGRRDVGLADRLADGLVWHERQRVSAKPKENDLMLIQQSPASVSVEAVRAELSTCIQMIWSMSVFKKTRDLNRSWQMLESIFLRCLAQLGGSIS